MSVCCSALSCQPFDFKVEREKRLWHHENVGLTCRQKHPSQHFQWFLRFDWLLTKQPTWLESLEEFNPMRCFVRLFRTGKKNSTLNFVAFPSSLSSDEESETSFDPLTTLVRTRQGIHKQLGTIRHISEWKALSKKQKRW